MSQYYKDWYARNKERVKKYHAEWYKKNKSVLTAKHEAYNQTERAKELRRARRTPGSETEKKNSQRRKRSNAVLKEKVFAVYGEVCACCGESDKRFLTVDHLNSDGHKEKGPGGNRRLKGDTLYRSILSGEKRGDIRILCFNCNFGRNNHGGTCPHIAKL